MLNRLKQFVEQSNASNSNTDKLNVLEQFKNDHEVVRMLRYVYSPYKQYYVTSKTCKKNFNLRDPNYIHDNIFDLLDDLTSRTYTGHDAIAVVNSFINMNEEYEDLIYSVIDKDLKTRTGAKVINKAFPND